MGSYFQVSHDFDEPESSNDDKKEEEDGDVAKKRGRMERNESHRQIFGAARL